MNQDKMLEMLSDVGAVITNSHIVYTSGKHGTAYVNKDALYPHTDQTSLFCFAIAGKFADDNVQVVIAPAVGGVILSQWTAYHLSRRPTHAWEVLGVYADKEKVDGQDVFVIKRGYDKLITGKRTLVVEDVLTTGNSVKKVVKAVRHAGGYVIGVGALCNRGDVTAEYLDVEKLVALVNVKLDSWDEADCPMCKAGVAINTDVGKGREFLARKRQTA